MRPLINFVSSRSLRGRYDRSTTACPDFSGK